MAFNAFTSWEVRTTGSDSNGGGFNTLATGTDFSQQDAPQIAYTDLVIGATNTTMTSVLHPFNAATVGNIINIVSGTGFTVQRVQVVSVTGVVATCDKACGTAASTGGSGNLGGGLLNPQTAMTLVTVSGNVIWVKAGTYSLTAALTFTTSSQAFIGYQTTHGDNVNAVTLTQTTSSVSLFLTTISSAARYNVRNITCTTTATTKSSCFNFGTSSALFILTNASISGFTVGIAMNTSQGIQLYDVIISGCTTEALTFSANSGSGPVIIDSCYISGNAIGLVFAPSAQSVSIKNSIIVGSTGGWGIDFFGTQTCDAIIANCIIANNSSGGLRLPSEFNSTPVGMFIIRSNIFYGNGTFGISSNTLSIALVSVGQNAYGANTTSPYLNMPAGTGDVTLTATPFTSSGTGDYSLNSSSGGGALCKGVGFPGIFPGGTTTGHIDIGGVQSSGTGATIQNYGYTG